MTRAEALQYIAAETGGIVNYRADRYLDRDTGRWCDGEPYPISVTTHGFHVRQMRDFWNVMIGGGAAVGVPLGDHPVASPDDAIALIREPHRWREMRAKWEAAP